MARALHPGRKLQAGEYQFARADTPSNILNRIARGDVFFYELVVPEGSNMFDIAASVSRFDFLKAPDFLRAARNPSLIRDLAPEAPTLEGYLFPATYRITRSTTRGAALRDDDQPVPQAVARVAGLGTRQAGQRNRDPCIAGRKGNRACRGPSDRRVGV